MKREWEPVGDFLRRIIRDEKSSSAEAGGPAGERGGVSPGGDPVQRHPMTNEGTAGLWLPEKHALKLTSLEAGWLYSVLDTLDKERGENWPTAKPGPNGEVIPTTMARRICDKLVEFWK
jgi:hypothetical protein